MSSDDEAPGRPAPAADAEVPLAERLRHVRWLGGGSGAGKSTVAGRLAAEHDLVLHRTDDTTTDHLRRSTPATCPQLPALDVGAPLDEDELVRRVARALGLVPAAAGNG